MEDRNEAVTFQGNPLTLVGPDLAVGENAPDFTVLANDLSEVTLADIKGKVVVISAVPSLDTPVCDVQTRRFNQEASALGSDVKILTVSMDLPFAQARWCGAAGVEAVQTVSDHRDASFAQAYGLLIKELRLITRAVLVLDKEGLISYKEVVNEITDEPDYKAALDAVKAVL